MGTPKAKFSAQRDRGGRGSDSRSHRWNFYILNFSLLNSRTLIFKFISMHECVAVVYASSLLLVVSSHSLLTSINPCSKLKTVPSPLGCVLGSLSGVSRLVRYLSPGEICHIAGVCSGRGWCKWEHMSLCNSRCTSKWPQGRSWCTLC